MRIPRWLRPLAHRVQSRAFLFNMGRYGHAAGRAQQRFCGTYVAVTGSVGKTTTTALIGQLLSDRSSVELAILRNALPQVYSVLRHLTRPTDYVVQEFSAHPPGMFDHAARHIRIDVAVVTTVGLDHRSRFKTEQAVAEEKGKLPAMVRPGGLVCLNADYPLVRAMADHATGCRVVLYGRSADAELQADNITAEWPLGLAFDLLVEGKLHGRVQTKLNGTHCASNVLAALSVVHGLGLDLDRAIARLVDFEPLAERLAPISASDGNTYMLDTAKASAWSTMLLARDLANWGPVHRTLVLGDLSDKGGDSQRKVRQIMRVALESCDVVVGIDEAAGQSERLRRTLEGEGSAGASRLFTATSVDDARSLIGGLTRGLVIVKGGRDLRRILPPGTADQRPPPERQRLG